MIRCIDAIVPAPPEVSRRAWECAFDLGQEHSAYLGEGPFHWLMHIVTGRDPLALSWAECGALLRMHRAARMDEGAR